jgi:hypothetical protein
VSLAAETRALLVTSNATTTGPTLMPGPSHGVPIDLLRKHPELLAALLEKLAGAAPKGRLEPDDARLRFAKPAEARPDRVDRSGGDGIDGGGGTGRGEVAKCGDAALSRLDLFAEGQRETGGRRNA